MMLMSGRSLVRRRRGSSKEHVNDWNSSGSKRYYSPLLSLKLKVFLGALLVALAVAVPTGSTAIPDGGVVIGGGSVTDVKREIDLARAAGVRWVALGGSWRGLEPTPESYKTPGSPGAAAWTALEEKASYAKSQGFKVYVHLSGAPSWAGGHRNIPPSKSNVPEYADFLSDLAAGLGHLIDAYAIWNEPNLPHFWNNPDPVRYVELQQAAYPAIKASDPTAFVLAAPLAPAGSGHISPYDFPTDSYAAGLKGYADVIAWNSFPPGAPEDDVKDSQGRPFPGTLPAQFYLRDLLDNLDPGRPVWITELGWSTCSGCANPAIHQNETTEALQADYVGRSFTYRRRHLEDSLHIIFWYTLRNTGSNPNNWVQTQGLIHWDWTPKPAYQALLDLSALIPDPPSGGSGGGGGGTTGGSEPSGGSNTQGPSKPADIAATLPASCSGATARRGVRVTPKLLDLNGRWLAVPTRVVTNRRLVVHLEGYRNGRWQRIARKTLRKKKTMRLQGSNRGYLALRLRSVVPGAAATPTTCQVILIQQPELTGGADLSHSCVAHTRRRTASASSARLARPSLRESRAFFTLTIKARARRGSVVLAIDAYRNGKWVKLERGRIKGSARIKARIKDRGYAAIRVSAKARGQKSPPACRTIILT